MDFINTRTDATTNSLWVRRINTRCLLTAMQNAEKFGRIDLSRETGISAPTISKLFELLENNGLIEQLNEVRSTSGRPTILYKLSESSHIIAVVVNLKKCTIGLFNVSGKILHEEKFRTPRSTDKLFDQLIKTIQKIRQKFEVTDLHGVGISLPGLFDSEGNCLHNPNLHFLKDANPREILSKALNCEITLIHESRALCRAEQVSDPEFSYENFVVVDASHGLSMGAVAGGQMIQGGRGLAGEIGHCATLNGEHKCGCGKTGCLETEATDRAFASRLSERLGKKLIIKEAIAEYKAGTPEAVECVEQTLSQLSTAIMWILQCLNPDAIYIYSNLLYRCPELLEKITAPLAERTLPELLEHCKITNARGDKLSGICAEIITKRFEETGILIRY